MLLKNLMLILSLIAGNEFTGSQDAENKTILLIRQTLRTEIRFVGFYLFTGLILSAAIIFSIIQAGFAFQMYVNQFTNGTIIQMLSFLIFAMLSLAMLYFVLPRRSQAQVPEINKAKNMSLQIDLQAIGLHFVDGFIKGLQSKNNQSHQQPKEF